MRHARDLGAEEVQTVVLGSNHDGLRFAQARGFVESGRYVLDGETVPYIHLVVHLEPAAPDAATPAGRSPRPPAPGSRR